MKNPEWSPGTWTYDPEECAVVSDQGPHIIAPLFGQCMDADGYLLAASKELYASLLALSRSTEGKCWCDPATSGSGPNRGHYIECRQAHAALAKARGESQ